MILLILGAYVLGSVPTGFWLAKALKGIDIRQYGSGSTGATNVWRCMGKGPGITVFIVDLLKGFAPVFVAIALTANPEFSEMDKHSLMPVLVALAALIGHSKSIFLNFQGGKSAATGLGTLLALKPAVGMATFASWLLMLTLFKIVSLASIMATLLCGVYMASAQAPASYVVYCVLGFAYVTYRHKANIERMLKGTEPRLSNNSLNLTRSDEQAKNDLIQPAEPKPNAESK